MKSNEIREAVSDLMVTGLLFGARLEGADMAFYIDQDIEDYQQIMDEMKKYGSY